MTRYIKWAVAPLLLWLVLVGCSLDQAESTPTEPGHSAKSTNAAASTGDSGQLEESTRLDPVVLAEMQELQEQVASLRGLSPLAPVARELLSQEALKQRIQQDLLQEYPEEEASDDARLLALFGFIPTDFDLWDFYNELYTEQVAGFYDDEDQVLYVVSGADFDGPERLTYVHEYGHALLDQHFDLDSGLGYSDEACEVDGERCEALQALIEGDASLLEEQWLRTFASQQDFDELIHFYNQFQSPTFDQAPAALKESFLFPYREGLEFVRWTFQQGGWAGVDDVFDDPPSSTEMILHPLRYPGDDPVQLEISTPDASALGSDWRLLDQGTLGEFDLKLLLAESLAPEAAAEAAAGWAGDKYVAYYNDNDQAGAWYIVQQWDTIRDAQDTYLAWRDYGEARYGDRIPDGQAYEWESEAGFARLELASNQTLWLVAPDSDVLQALRETIQFPADRQ